MSDRAKKKLPKIATRIEDVGKIKKPRRIALYGRAGSGKTTLACTFPKPLLIDAKDDGTDSVSDVKGLKVLRAENWDDLIDLYWYLEDDENHDFETIIIDTVTMMQDFAIRHVASKKDKKMKGVPGEFGTLTKQDWGEVSSLMKTWIMNFRELPLNIVFIAQERIFNAGDESDDIDG